MKLTSVYLGTSSRGIRWYCHPKPFDSLATFRSRIRFMRQRLQHHIRYIDGREVSL